MIKTEEKNRASGEVAEIEVEDVEDMTEGIPERDILSVLTSREGRFRGENSDDNDRIDLGIIDKGENQEKMLQI